MNIITVEINKLIDSEYNPRIELTPDDEEYQSIKRSIESFGYVQPIIINANYEILAGHQRKNVLLDLGRKKVDCVLVKLSKKKEKALNVALNKIDGKWDDEKLFEVLRDIKVDESDFLLTGFNETEFDDLFKKFDEEGYEYSKSGSGSHGKDVVEDDYDASNSLEKETDIKKGDIFELGNHKLMCGDCSEEDDVESLMSNEFAKILLTSPPYSDIRTYGLSGEDLEVEKLVKFINLFKPYTDYHVINLGIKRENYEIIQYWNTYIDEARTAGYKFLSWNVWDKKEAGSIGNQSSFFPIIHEWVFVFGTEYYDLNKTVEKKEENIIENDRDRCRRNKDGETKRSSSGNTSEKYKKMESILSLNPEKGPIRSQHPAVFPVNFSSEYIKAMTNKDDIIIDCFGGSGSTLIACEQLERKCYMMEISPQYCQVIIDRWEEFTGKEAKKIN